MKHIFLISTGLILGLLFSACGNDVQSSVSSQYTPDDTEAAETAAAEEESAPSETAPLPSPEEILLEGMSLREKVGQLFIIRPDALDLSIPFEALDNSSIEGKTDLTPEMEQTLQNYPVGGFIHFQKNIQSPQQIQAFNQTLSEASVIPPFLSVDEEGGLVARLAGDPSFGLPRFESAAAVGQRGEDAAQEMGWIIGNYLAEYSFNMDFAPVADVNTNPSNKVIGNRAFSSDPRQAALCARAMADGLRRSGIIPVFKHFPGHGDTAEDSHQQLAVSRKNREDLLNCEWLPFQQAEARECIMVGHIALPQLTGDMTPAAFSPMIVTDTLKGDLQYEGLVITDSLSMGAVIRQYNAREAALNALWAGCDILLMPASLTEAFDGIVEAVEDGSFPEDRLDQIVLRILKTKIDYHILNTES